jgi:outer membrane lipoprotein LolB
VNSILKANILTAMLLVTACSAPLRMEAPVNPDWEQRQRVLLALNDWEFTGSISVRDENESHSSRIRWRQQQEDYRINLWGTFNAGATEISGSPDMVQITRPGEDIMITDSAEQLIYDELGYELPVSQLNYWLRGIPAPDSQVTPEFDENNQLVRLRQSGWQIDYMGYSNYGTETLPVRIRMVKSPLRVDLLRMNWTLITDT